MLADVVVAYADGRSLCWWLVTESTEAMAIQNEGRVDGGVQQMFWEKL